MELRGNGPLLALNDNLEDLPGDELGKTMEETLQTKREVDSSYQALPKLAWPIDYDFRKVYRCEDRE